jgi:plastocyanin/mono/diheme cytochrome c family protein
MNKRPFAIFAVVAVIGIIVIPLWAITQRGSPSAASESIHSYDKTAQNIFQTNCGSCHTLAAGGTDGVQGPNLDIRFQGQESKSTVNGNCVIVLNAIENGLGGRMPAGILQGIDAKTVASFVARNVAYVNPATTTSSTEITPSDISCKAPSTGGAAPSGGKQKPSKPSGGKPKPSKPSGKQKAAGGASTLKVAADPTGQLAFTQTSLSAKAGNVTVDFTNQAPIQHDFCIQDQSGKELGCTSVIQGASTSKAFNGLKAGSYTFFCSVDGHEAAGMKGKLTVK